MFHTKCILPCYFAGRVHTMALAGSMTLKNRYYFHHHKILSRYCQAFCTGSFHRQKTRYRHHPASHPRLSTTRTTSKSRSLKLSSQFHPVQGSRICVSLIHTRGPGSSVGIETAYGLDGPGIESPEEGEIFRTCPDRP